MIKDICYHEKNGDFYIGDERVCYACYVCEINRRTKKKIEQSIYGGRLEIEDE